MATVTADDVLAAADRLRGHVVHTHSAPSQTLSAMLGADLVLKLENLQFTGSFKDRGAGNRLLTLTPEEAERGVIAVSAGNHAQGVAYHGGRLGIPVTIVMPTSAPFAKVRNTEALGARVVQAGRTFADAQETANHVQADEGLTFVAPFEDPAVIAGQGTVAVEFLADHPDLDVLVVPVGGGGLLAGMATYARARRPDLEIVGVQSAAYPAVATRFGHHPPPDAAGDTIADGIAVARPGALTTDLIRHHADDVVTASEDHIEQAVAMLIEIEKTVAEGAGAIALAAVLEHPERFAGRRVGLVISGGNIDTRVLASVLMRQLVHTGRVLTLRVTIDDLPGQLAPVVALVAEQGANLIEIEHRRLFDPISARRANVDLVVETRDRAHGERLVTALTAAGYRVTHP